MGSGRIVGQNILKLLKGSFVISLLLLYFLGSSRIESFHKFFHEDVVLHTAQDESDPCHLTLYHQQRDGGCDHTSHFVEEEKCSFCDIQFYSNPIVAGSVIALPIAFNLVSAPLWITQYIEAVDYQFIGRAPPVS